MFSLKEAHAEADPEPEKPFAFVVRDGNETALRLAATSELELAQWLRWINEIKSLSHGSNHTNDEPPALPPVPKNACIVQQHVSNMNQESDATLADFERLKVIGKGSFGKVLLVRKKQTKRVYAIKVLSKRLIVARNEVEHTRSEKSILMKLECPFLVALHYVFETPAKLYFVMDYINGGELFFHLHKEKKFSEERVRFYAAEIVAGLDYLHAAGVIYRDLKPENLLLTNEGHLVMTDFGLSKEGLHDDEDQTATYCGTPEYLAPEILSGGSYTKAVDWWAFATLVYEMLTGLPPFYSDDVQTMYNKVLSADLALPPPPAMSTEAGDMLQRLLERDPVLRLAQASAIKQHAFFAPIDFHLLLQRRLQPPWVPDVKGEDDTRNIDETFLQESVQDDDAEDDEEPDAAIANAFEGFTYTGHTY